MILYWRWFSFGDLTLLLYKIIKSWLFCVAKMYFGIKQLYILVYCKEFSFLVLPDIDFIVNEPVHEISNNVVCATSKASDQPAHTRSLIRAFASRLSILRLLSY